MAIPDRETFANIYSGSPPWDIGRPQKALVDVAEQVKGAILDAGCGTGDNAIFFARRGHAVTGIDFLEEPIRRAKQKSAQHQLSVSFQLMNALELKSLPRKFDSAIDSGLFHVFSDGDRQRYVEGLAAVLNPGGHLYLLCFSDAEPGEQGPRRISRQELETAFEKGWTIESIEPQRFEVRPDLKDFHFSPGGPKAWFVIARRD